MIDLKQKFPRASNDFLKINNSLQSAKPQPTTSDALGGTVQGKKESMGRVTLSFRGFFVRLKDPDNFAGSLKNCIDGVRRCGLVDDDSPDKIKLICEQEKVEHYGQERIELKIIYP